MGKFNLLTTISADSSGMKAGLEAAASATRAFASGVESESKKISFAFRDAASMGVGEMRKELVALRNTKLAGYTDVEIKAINSRIGELMDSMGDLKAQQKGLGTEFGTLAAKGLQAFAAMGEIGVGVAQMFGANKEEAEKYQQTMVTLIGVTQGMGVVQDAFETKIFASIAARVKDTVATVAQTAAQWALNASLLVIIGTIGAAVVVVAAIAYGIYALTQGYDEQADAVAKLREEKEALIKVSEGEGKAVDHQIKLMQAEGKEAIDIKRMEIAAAQIKLENAKNLYNKLEAIRVSEKGASEEEEKQRVDAKKSYYDLKDTLEIYGAELTVLTSKKVKHVGVIKEENSALEEQMRLIHQIEKTPYTILAKELDASGGVSDMTSTMTGKGISQKADPTKLQTRGQADLTKAVKNSNSELKKQVETMGAMRDLMGGFGEAAANAFGEQSGAAKAFAVGAVIANAAMAIMGTWAGYAKFGPWGTALAVAQTAMIAGVAATQIGNVTGAFEMGGIVRGQSFSGDLVPVRVNSGEMILNQSQQANLFAMANGGGYGGGELTTRVSGADLVIVLNNHYRKVRNTG